MRGTSLNRSGSLSTHRVPRLGTLDRFEVTLRRREADFAFLFEHHPEAMVLIDLHTYTIKAVNEAACRTYGYTREEFVGLPALEIVHPARQVEALNYLKLADNRRSSDVKHRTKDGTIIDVHIEAVTLTMGGRQVRLISTHDVTRQKMLEEQLRQAQKLDALGKVTGEVAHDFNNLLAVMMASVEMMLDTLPADHAAHQSGATALSAAEQAATLTRRLLAFARQQELAPQRLDPKKAVPHLDAILRSAVSVIELDFDIDPATHCCVVDRGQFETALLNLVVNARDASDDQGRITIGVRERRICEKEAAQDPVLRPGEWVAISVADTGCGMPETVRLRLFEPFFTTKDPGKGTGLGLSQVHGFVSQSQGFVTVESAPGEGTRIAMHFPVSA